MRGLGVCALLLLSIGTLSFVWIFMISYRDTDAKLLLYENQMKNRAGKKEDLETGMTHDTGMQHLPRIAVFHVYTGSPYILSDLSLLSYYKNKEMLDLYILVDKHTQYDQLEARIEQQYPNIYVKQFDNLSLFIIKRLEELFPELKPLFEEQEITNFGWNLCDVRPFFYSVFETILDSTGREYSHWGWTDKHTILGTLVDFVTMKELATFDVLSFLETGVTAIFTSGTFSVFKIKFGPFSEENRPRGIWSQMEHDQIIRTLADMKNNENDEYRFSLSLIRQHNITFLASITNHRDYKEVGVRYDPYRLMFLEQQTKTATESAGYHLPENSAVPVEIRGRWEKDAIRKMVPTKPGYRFVKSLDNKWTLFTGPNSVKNISMCHCRRAPQEI